ncbi:MAG: pantoate--beta-alanine ligase [Gammaproteobacteria bacterium]|nr:pantoate--beta-alanine ligase [Gammaproteobacteria bacterium]
MIELPSPQRASKWCAEQRARGATLGYVPTMGALHAGHLSLVERAVRENAAACASIFVNPLQFNDRADLRDYPRDWQRDTALLNRAGCAMVFTGTPAEFFPDADGAGGDGGDGGGGGDIDGSVDPGPDSGVGPGALDSAATIDPGPGARGLEGEFRPGHLQGVCRIVARLFATVGPCRAYFGEKDFQQTLVVAHLARRFGGIEVRVCPTVRDASGLALSSRNRRLNAAGRDAAAQIYQALLAAKTAWQSGARAPAALESVMRARLQHPQIALDYATVRDPANWSEHPPPAPRPQARALIAATIGKVRLIDNLELD